MRDLLGNVRYTLRQFRAAPAFVAAAVLTLALGIGGTTAIFTLVDAVMLRSLPVGIPGAFTASEMGMTAASRAGPRTGGVCFPIPSSND